MVEQIPSPRPPASPYQSNPSIYKPPPDVQQVGLPPPPDCLQGQTLSAYSTFGPPQDHCHSQTITYYEPQTLPMSSYGPLDGYPTLNGGIQIAQVIQHHQHPLAYTDVMVVQSSNHLKCPGGPFEPPWGTVECWSCPQMTPVTHLPSLEELDELEKETRRTLMNDKWKQLFDKYDPEGFGEILWEDFLRVIDNSDFREHIDSTKRELLRTRAQERASNAITFDDFVSVDNLKRGIYCGAIYQRAQELHGLSFLKALLGSADALDQNNYIFEVHTQQ